MPIPMARGDGADLVNTGHPVCIAPGTIATLSCSPDTFIVGVCAHRLGDTNTEHTHCPPVYSTNVVSASTAVFINGKGAARLGDPYECGAFIETVNQNVVFCD